MFVYHKVFFWRFHGYIWGLKKFFFWIYEILFEILNERILKRALWYFSMRLGDLNRTIPGRYWFDNINKVIARRYVHWARRNIVLLLPFFLIHINLLGSFFFKNIFIFIYFCVCVCVSPTFFFHIFSFIFSIFWNLFFF